MARWTSPFKSALRAWYWRQQDARARRRPLAAFFASLPRWEQATILAPALLWLCNLALYNASADYAFWAKVMLGDLSLTLCATVDIDTLCSAMTMTDSGVIRSGPRAFFAEYGSAGVQLVSLHLLTLALTLLLVAVQLARFLWRVPAAAMRPRWRDWLFAAILLGLVQGGVILYGARMGLKGTATIALLACVSLFYVRVILSPLTRSSAATPTGPQQVVRRLR